MKLELITDVETDKFNSKLAEFMPTVRTIVQSTYKTTYDASYNRVRYSVLITYIPRD